MIVEMFSNLNDSMIIWYTLFSIFWKFQILYYISLENLWLHRFQVHSVPLWSSGLTLYVDSFSDFLIVVVLTFNNFSLITSKSEFVKLQYSFTASYYSFPERLKISCLSDLSPNCTYNKQSSHVSVLPLINHIDRTH